MRAGPILVLLLFVLLVAAFGVQVFGWILLFGLAVLLLGVGGAAFAIWSIKRRMRRNLEQLTRVLAGARGGPGAAGPDGPAAPEGPSAAARRDAIDVEPVVRKPRDGADAPEEP